MGFSGCWMHWNLQKKKHMEIWWTEIEIKYIKTHEIRIKGQERWFHPPNSFHFNSLFYFLVALLIFIFPSGNNIFSLGLRKRQKGFLFFLILPINCLWKKSFLIQKKKNEENDGERVSPVRDSEKENEGRKRNRSYLMYERTSGVVWL